MSDDQANVGKNWILAAQMAAYLQHHNRHWLQVLWPNIKPSLTLQMLITILPSATLLMFCLTGAGLANPNFYGLFPLKVWLIKSKLVICTFSRSCMTWLL